MDSVPKISVIVPVYNCENYIDKCITSILSQTYSDFELLICDDGSTDNTVERISSYNDSRIRLIRNEQNHGNVFTFNKLIENAKGEFVALMDADDWSSEDRLEKQINFLEEHPDYVACYTQRIKTDEKEKELSRSDYPLSQDKIFSKMPYHFLFVSAGLMVKRAVYNELGTYPDYFAQTGGADWYWAYKLFEKYKVCNLPSHGYYNRENPNSITRSSTDFYKKFFVSELIIFLINQRKKHGSDGLENEKLRPDLEQYEAKLKHKFESDPIIQHKKQYVQARLGGDQKRRKEVYKEMMKIAPFRTLIWFVLKPFSVLFNKVRFSLS